MSYIGSTPTTQSFIAGTDYFNGDGSTTAFTLSRSVVSTNDIQATVNNVVQQPNTAYTVSGTTITFTSAPSAGTANIYVRYLSTTTQSITPSQNTVSYNTLNSDTQSKLGISFKNRIINGAQTIAQRGTSATFNTTQIFCTDRFRTGSNGTWGSGVFAATQSSNAPAGFTNSLGLTVTTPDNLSSTGNAYTLVAPIEGYNIADLGWGTANAQSVTLSFWVQSSLTGTFAGLLQGSYIYAFTYSITAANTWTKISVTIPGSISGSWNTTNSVGVYVRFSLGAGSAVQTTAGSWAVTTNQDGVTGQTNLVSTNGATWYLTGVQLEVGTQATTFDYRSIGTELALCQRYCVKFGGNNNYETFFPIVIAYSTTAVQGNCVLPVEMRATPSATINTIQMENGSSTKTQSSPNLVVYTNNSGTKCLNCGFGNFTGLNQLYPYWIEAAASTSSYFLVSAEL